MRKVCGVGGTRVGRPARGRRCITTEIVQFLNQLPVLPVFRKKVVGSRGQTTRAKGFLVIAGENQHPARWRALFDLVQHVQPAAHPQDESRMTTSGRCDSNAARASVAVSATPANSKPGTVCKDSVRISCMRGESSTRSIFRRVPGAGRWADIGPLSHETPGRVNQRTANSNLRVCPSPARDPARTA